MTRTTAILLAVMTGTVWAQNPDIIQNTKSQLQAVEKKQTAATDAALQAAQGNSAASQKKPSAQSKPAAGQSAAKPVSTIQAKPASVPAQNSSASKPANPAPAKPVTVAQVKPAAVPAKPATATQPKATPAATKPVTAAPVKTVAPAAQANVAPVASPNKPATSAPVAAAKQAPPSKPAVPGQGKVAVVPVQPVANSPAQSASSPMQGKPVANPAPAKSAAAKPAAPVKAVPETKVAPKATANDPKADNSGDTETEKKQTYATASGRRDPFVSPIVQHIGGSGCNTGKRCLAIDQILLKGIIKSEGGMIAVVVNSADKAYFLRENDPVFNGYVVKITGDSVVFQETFQDRLGKMSTREVTKKITVPAV